MTTTGTPLAVRLPNWIGDVCMSLPTLDALRQAGAELHLCGKGWFADLLAGYPASLHVLRGSKSEQSATLRAVPASQLLCFPNSFSSAWLAKRAGKRVCGYRGEFRSPLLRHAVKPGKHPHEVERFWHLGTAGAEAFGLDVTAFQRDTPRPVLPLHDDHLAEAEQLRTQLPERFSIICPTATGTVNGQDKRWPHFAALATRCEDEGITPVCCPGPGEVDDCRAVAANGIVLESVGLGSFAGLMRQAQWVASNDSGPMHLAAAAGAHVLGIYGVSDPRRYRPWGGHTIGDAHGWPNVDTVWQYLHDHFQQT